VRSEGNMSLKNPVTPPGIDPGTVRLVAQRPTIVVNDNNKSNDNSRFTIINLYNTKVGFTGLCFLT
jgi:hypothetical protein